MRPDRRRRRPPPQVCKEGKALSPDQAALLRVFEIKMAVFRFTLLAAWSAEGDAYESLADGDGGSGSGDDGGDGGGEGGEDDAVFGGFPEGDAAMMLPPGV